MTARTGWSLIVPSRNGGDTLPECLAALARHTVPPDGLKLILVNNANTDAATR